MRRVAALAAILGLALAWTQQVRVLAQDARPLAQEDSRERLRSADQTSAVTSVRLPADSHTQHTIELAGTTLAFTATAGSIPITNAAGQLLAEIAYVAYRRNGLDAQRRPVTFAFNGGPGSASTWLHLGAMGPWRLPLNPDTAQAEAAPLPQANAETWLDFTDLVFIDPAGTGYSRIMPTADGDERQGAARRGGSRFGQGSVEQGGPRWFWSIPGDIASLADFIQTWSRRHDRLQSPKMIVGESYGGFRAPRLASLLARQRGIPIKALVLVSPVLDFEGRRSGHSPTYYANLLPSLAATARELQDKPVTREALRPVEEYARTEYLLDLGRGPRNQQALERIIAHVSEITALPTPVVRSASGRLSGYGFMIETYRPQRRIASLYDATVTRPAREQPSPGGRFEDPFTTLLTPPMTSAMLALYRSRLGWQVDRTYHMLNTETNRGWSWGNSPNPPESISALREMLAHDSSVRVLVAHGYFDLVTPYMASEVMLDSLPPFGDPGRVALAVYPGGHMFYSRSGARRDFRRDAERLLREAIAPAQRVEPSP